MTAFDDYGNPMPWGKATWRDRIVLVLFMAVMWGIIFPAMCIAVLVFIGMIIEHQAEISSAFDWCQKHAITPYEYHQCK